MKIVFNFLDSNCRIKFLRRRKEWIEACINEEGFLLKSINFIFCSDEFLIDINQKFLNHDFYTDVITFSNGFNSIIDGEVYISIDRVKDNSKIYNVTFDNELNRVLIHGALHLMKYNDNSIVLKELMTGKENYYLRKLEREEI